MQANEPVAGHQLRRTPRDSKEQSGIRSAQQAAAAWAWLQRAGHGASASRRSDGVDGRRPQAAGLVAAHRTTRNAPLPPTRFKEEFLSSGVAPRKFAEITPAFLDFKHRGLSRDDGEQRQDDAHSEDDDLIPFRKWDIFSADDEGLEADSSLLDKLELESMFRHVRQLQLSELVLCTGSVSAHRSSGSLIVCSDAPLRRSCSDSRQHRRIRKSSSVDDLTHHFAHMLQQLQPLRVIKLASRSPAMCTSVKTIQPMKDARQPHRDRHARRAIRLNVLQEMSCSGRQEVSEFSARRPLRRAKSPDDIERTASFHHHSHSHRHIHHHHHHHHYHLLHDVSTDKSAMKGASELLSSSSLDEKREKALSLRDFRSPAQSPPSYQKSSGKKSPLLPTLSAKHFRFPEQKRRMPLDNSFHYFSDPEGLNF
ncbi:hypothetical protein KP509_13G013400 [Ceratopteris richardii]|uniref:Uncharacterized protein n=1 Tax=Ceratopteris richardii TaxID=49495 RepID=A0A8T2TDR5_CERRI|nr:hypothetical protein KP509_13G013400 [Ceratopteris richardii]